MGHMINRICLDNNIPVINIVRREEQAEELLKRYGKPEGEGNTVYALNSEEPQFLSDLKRLAHKLNATVVIECVAGPLVGKISACLP